MKWCSLQNVMRNLLQKVISNWSVLHFEKITNLVLMLFLFPSLLKQSVLLLSSF
jgi:hypothetical protein